MGGAIAQAAMIDAAVCYSILALGASIAGVRNGVQGRNVRALSFYGQAMRAVSGVLNNEAQSPRDETILAATTLWNVSGAFGDAAAVHSHGKAVRGLVATRGGLAELGMGGVLAQYISFSEILYTLVLKDDAHLPRARDPGSFHPSPAAVYGRAFGDPSVSNSLHPNLVQICLTACRLTEIMEKAAREDVTPQEFMFFVAKMWFAATERARFLAKCYNSGTINECILVVVEIFATNVFLKKPVGRFLNVSFCSQLHRALMQTNLQTFWDDKIDLLVWVLFITGTNEFEFDEKELFLDLLRRAISSRYDSKEWPPDWRERELENLTSLVWSKVRLTDAFRKICDALEGGAAVDTKANPASNPTEL